jgi:hypothetical protein
MKNNNTHGKYKDLKNIKGICIYKGYEYNPSCASTIVSEAHKCIWDMNTSGRYKYVKTINTANIRQHPDNIFFNFFSFMGFDFIKTISGSYGAASSICNAPGRETLTADIEDMSAYKEKRMIKITGIFSAIVLSQGTSLLHKARHEPQIFLSQGNFLVAYALHKPYGHDKLYVFHKPHAPCIPQTFLYIRDGLCRSLSFLSQGNLLFHKAIHKPYASHILQVFLHFYKGLDQSLSFLSQGTSFTDAYALHKPQIFLSQGTSFYNPYALHKLYSPYAFLQPIREEKGHVSAMLYTLFILSYGVLISVFRTEEGHIWIEGGAFYDCFIYQFYMLFGCFMMVFDGLLYSF